MSADKIAFQGEFCPAPNLVKGHKQFNEYRRQIERIDEIIQAAGIDLDFAGAYIGYLGQFRKNGVSAKQSRKDTKYAIQALRCNILRHYLGLSFAELSCRIAESPLLQNFICVSRIDWEISVPSKSLLFDYSKILPTELIDGFIRKILGSLLGDGGQLGLEKPLVADEIFVDSCCIEADIHFPVDWVLLRDAVRTTMKSIITIRKHGLVHRMRSPEKFMSEMNRLCMAMSGSRRKKDSEKERKKIFRKMKKLEKVSRAHGWRYCLLLEERWETDTDFEKFEAMEIAGRMRNVLGKSPAAVKQAHERIIGARHLENSDKILSLYDSDVNVIVRGKADAEVEFGNSLYIAEQKDGFIVDWNLYRKSAPGDTSKLEEGLARMKSLGMKVSRLTGDRGFDGEKTRKALGLEKIYNGICPKNPVELEKRNKSNLFRMLQKRRAQTEGRISILRNGFIGNPASGKSFDKRHMDTAWAVLAHNLWVVARLPEKEQELLKTG